MGNIKPLTMDDINNIRPLYQTLPTAWRCSGTHDITAKNGKIHPMLCFVREDGSEIRFFADKMSKDESGQYYVELSHYEAQVKRAAEWAKKTGA